MNEPADAEETRYLAPSPRYGFEDRIALITDGSQTIGRTLALSLAARGTIPVISYSSDEEEGALGAVDAIERLGISTISVHVDPQDADDIEFMFRRVQQCFGRLDFFISQAGTSASQPLLQLQPDDLERSFQANVSSFVLSAQHAARLMDRGGRIVATSGCGSQYPFPSGPSDRTTHAEVEEWARHIAVELAPRGVNVNVLRTGIIETEFASATYDRNPATSLDTIRPRIPKRRAGFVEEVTDCALFLLSPASEYVTGSTLVVDGGLTAALGPFQSALGAR